MGVAVPSGLCSTIVWSTPCPVTCSAHVPRACAWGTAERKLGNRLARQWQSMIVGSSASAMAGAAGLPDVSRDRGSRATQKGAFCDGSGERAGICEPRGRTNFLWMGRCS
jgi:hypothetical protein